MATSKQRSAIYDNAQDVPMIINVTAEHTIGQVTVSDDGGEPVIVAAMKMIGEYEYDHPRGGTYRVPMPNDTTMVARIEYGGDDATLVEWLQRARPSVWQEWGKVRGQM